MKQMEKDTPREESLICFFHRLEDEALLKSNRDALQPSRGCLASKDYPKVNPLLGKSREDRNPACRIDG